MSRVLFYFGSKRIYILVCIIFFIIKIDSPYAGWKEIIDQAKLSVLMIEIETLADLENESPGCYQATGFVVDAEKGIILTNRHVVGASPSTARATFSNKEKISIKPLYYDPLHDFGFYRFNPRDLRFSKPKEFKLGDSDKVKIGEEIRVLGNNAAEGFSILEGTISWIKKNAPTYSDIDTYREFNTYYFQTSADISGGSSGGPILNQKGEVVAINSSSKSQTTVSWGLPINLVKGTLESLRRGRSIKRGDIGARIIFSSFDEIADYGFPKKLTSALKKNNNDIEGLLTVADTIPKTDASDHLKPGDVIWELNGSKVKDSFVKYENILNANVGKEVAVKLFRDGKEISFKIAVIDIEKLKIKSFVRIGSDHFSNVPLFLALANNIPFTGVYTPYIRYNFSERDDFPEFLVITQLGGIQINDINDFYNELSKYKNGDSLKMKYNVLKENQREEEKVFKINWEWFKPDFFELKESAYEWNKVR